MKKIILLALTALMMVGCKYTKEETIKNMSVDGYILKEIDSCEYFMVHISSYMDGGGYLPIHKNNCRFCKERMQKELKELVEQLGEVIMKAKIRKTGEIVNISDYATITLDNHDSWGNPIEVRPEEIELIQEQTEDEHWQDVRERAAIIFMNKLISPISYETDKDKNKKLIKHSIELADSLIEELKKK